MSKKTKIYTHRSIKADLIAELRIGAQTIADALTYLHEEKRWKSESAISKTIRKRAVEKQEELLNFNKEFLKKH